MSEWITDRQPTAEDAIGGTVLVSCDDGRMYFGRFDHVKPDEPWQPLPAPYIKPKRFKALWNVSTFKWIIVNDVGSIVATLEIDVEARSTAQRILDIFKEVLP